MDAVGIGNDDSSAGDIPKARATSDAAAEVGSESIFAIAPGDVEVPLPSPASTSPALTPLPVWVLPPVPESFSSAVVSAVC